MGREKEPLQLSETDQAILAGERGAAMQFAMQVVVRAGELMGAPHLIDTGFVHVDACHYSGTAHVDFARYFVETGARFEIAAWTNTVPVSLVQDEVRDGPGGTAFLREARELTELYVSLGCRPVWTCAPYQLPGGPRLGDHIVVGESNAVAYYNSAVGARTNKYGDFLDVCAGLVARVPFAGLHTDEGRRGTLCFDVSGVPEALRESELFCHVLGHLIGHESGANVPVIIGLPEKTGPDSLKALGAAAAASGAVGLFHAVGVTPEAPTLEAALGGVEGAGTVTVSPQALVAARDELSSAAAGPVDMVALGTPHFSYDEFGRLVRLLDGRKVSPGVTVYVSTSRHVAALTAERGWNDELTSAGVEILVDTCTYFSPAVRGCKGRVMTNSAKWAYYAPGTLAVEVAFGSLEDCVESAVCGEVRRDELLWRDKAWGLA